MNKRMIELAQQAGIIGQSETTLAPNVGKFAELIVQECLTKLTWSDLTEDFDKGIVWSAEQIRQHFGDEI